MLKYLDVLIGLSTVMLLVSMVVMAVTHFIMAALKTRSRNLRSSLAQLLGEIDPSLSGDVGEKIVKAILSSGQIKSAVGAANIVHREDFIRAVLDLATESSGFEDAAKKTLQAALKRAGIDQPDKTLDGIHSLALELERQNPELASNVRYNLAIMQQAESKFVNRVHAWFDRTMDRASEKFKVQSRLWTYVIALVIAFYLQLDTVQIVNRLALDDVLRTAMVSQAQEIVKAPEVVSIASQSAPASTTAQPAATSPAPAPTAQNQPADLAKDKQAIAYAQSTLGKFGLLTMPNSPSDCIQRWKDDVANKQWISRLLGVLVSTVLLSLGAPFWYNALANLLRLRSVAAQKDDEQRAARSSQPDAATAATSAAQAATPSWMRGEQGNPQLVG